MGLQKMSFHWAILQQILAYSPYSGVFFKFRYFLVQKCVTFPWMQHLFSVSVFSRCLSPAQIPNPCFQLQCRFLRDQMIELRPKKKINAPQSIELHCKTYCVFKFCTLAFLLPPLVPNQESLVQHLWSHSPGNLLLLGRRHFEHRDEFSQMRALMYVTFLK